MINIPDNLAGSPSVRADSEILDQLADLAHSPGFIYSLAQAAVCDLFFTPADDVNADWAEGISFQELALVSGLAVTQPIDTTEMPSQETSDCQIGSLRSLLSQLHEAYWRPASDLIDEKLDAIASGVKPDPSGASVFYQGRMLVEPMFYSGSGAFDFQYLELAMEKYKRDSEWLNVNVGLTIDQLVETATELKKLQIQRVAAYRSASTHDERCLAALATFSFTREDLQFLTDGEFHAFVGKFTLVPGAVEHSLTMVGDLNELEFRPIIQLDDKDFFMPVSFALARSIYESPFYWMMEEKTYRNRLSEHRGDATETIAQRLLKGVFADRVYRNVQVDDGERDVSEIDVLALAGNRAIIVQAKSKRLTQMSRQGDDNRIKADFTGAIQDAYAQGLTCRQALLGGGYSLKDNEGNPIAQTEDIKDAYVICLTLDHFPGLPSMVDGLLEKGSRHPYPVAISVFELDAITTYLPGPYDFVYYIRNRVMWADKIRAASEMALLGFHLKHKLFLPRDADAVGVPESYSQLINANFPVIRGEQPPTAAAAELLPTWRNEEFESLVYQIASADNSDLTDAVFMLYDLSNEDADDLVSQIKAVRRRCEASSSGADMTKLMGNYGISYICFPERRADNWPVLRNHANARKYKSRADEWLALGAVIDSPQLVEFVAYSESPWQVNPELDRLARSVFKTGSVRMPRGRKLGRNEPCWCGSKKKYKSCHSLGKAKTRAFLT